MPLSGPGVRRAAVAAALLTGFCAYAAWKLLGRDGRSAPGQGPPPIPGSFSAVAREGSNKGALAALRSALESFSEERRGGYPPELDELSPRYLRKFPSLRAPGHPESREVTAYDGEVCSAGEEGAAETGRSLDGAKLMDSGKWGYVRDARASCRGSVFIDCTHKDSKGKSWHGY